MPNTLEPSDVLRRAMHRYKEDLERVSKLPPLWRCFDCGQWIPRCELPMRCRVCSGPDTQGPKVGYRRRKIRNDAMICLRCCDKHSHLKEHVFELMQLAYEQGIQREKLRVMTGVN
jgi:hypothetical protein